MKIYVALLLCVLIACEAAPRRKAFRKREEGENENKGDMKTNIMKKVWADLSSKLPPHVRALFNDAKHCVEKEEKDVKDVEADIKSKREEIEQEPKKEGNDVMGKVMAEFKKAFDNLPEHVKVVFNNGKECVKQEKKDEQLIEANEESEEKGSLNAALDEFKKMTNKMIEKKGESQEN